jgi:hypothetical protein
MERDAAVAASQDASSNEMPTRGGGHVANNEEEAAEWHRVVGQLNKLESPVRRGAEAV